MSPPQSRGDLDVYLDDQLLGRLSDRTVGFVAFDFDETAIEQHGVGSRVLSLSMPVSWDVVDPMIATAFFAGLLPEGEARQRLTEEFHVSADDPFGLLALIGRESAGALVIVPSGQQPPSQANASVKILSDEELAAAVDQLALSPLGITVEDDEIRLSLAGVQDKLALVAVVGDQGERFGLPLNGHPSTHILKPPPTGAKGERFPNLVENEAFCLTLASALGIPTASFEVLELNGVRVLVVARYDRIREQDRILRVHQEDACQAAAVNPAFKYETSGGPSLAAIAGLIGEHSSQPGRDRLTLVRLMIANLLLGNCDAHGKNISFLHGRQGVQLAPAYDIVSTQAYAHTDRLGMRIGGVERLRDVSREAVLAQGEAMGVRRGLTARQLSEIADVLPASLVQAQEQAERAGWGASILERIAADTTARAEVILQG